MPPKPKKRYLQVYCRACFATSNRKKPKILRKECFNAKLMDDGTVVSPPLTIHLECNKACEEYYQCVVGGINEDFTSSLRDYSSSLTRTHFFEAESRNITKCLGLTNAPNGPQCSYEEMEPRSLDQQVMFNPSTESISRTVVQQELDNLDSITKAQPPLQEHEPSTDDDQQDDLNPYHDSPDDMEDDDQDDLNPCHGDPPDDVEDEIISRHEPSDHDDNVFVTPHDARDLRDLLKVKLKLMKLMRKHNIPKAAEREIYEWAHAANEMKHFSWRNPDQVFMTRETAMSEIYSVVPELNLGSFKEQLIDWRCNKVTTELGSTKQRIKSGVTKQNIFVRSFNDALRSLLTNKTLIEQSNLSFPNRKSPFKIEHDPPITNETLVSELHHGKWFIETWKQKCSEAKQEILVPIILYMDSIQIDANQKNSVEPLNMTLGIFSDLTRTRPDAWETIYFHPKGRDKLKSIDNLHNLHEGLRAALRSLREACENSEDDWVWKNLPWNDQLFEVKMKFAVAFFIGDMPMHDQICGHFQNRTKRKNKKRKLKTTNQTGDQNEDEGEESAVREEERDQDEDEDERKICRHCDCRGSDITSIRCRNNAQQLARKYFFDMEQKGKQIPPDFWDSVALQEDETNPNKNDVARYTLSPNYRRIQTAGFEYFIEKVLATVNPKQNDFRRRKSRNTISEIFSVSDEAFAVLFLFNEKESWTNTDPMKKKIQKKFTSSTDGNKDGWSVVGRNLYNHLYSEIKKRREETPSKDIESTMKNKYKQIAESSKQRTRREPYANDTGPTNVWNAMETVDKESEVYRILHAV